MRTNLGRHSLDMFHCFSVDHLDHAGITRIQYLTGTAIDGDQFLAIARAEQALPFRIQIESMRADCGNVKFTNQSLRSRRLDNCDLRREGDVHEEYIRNRIVNSP